MGQPAFTVHNSLIASGIDHVPIAVPDLERSRREFESLGFQVAPRANHEHFGTANHLCVFDGIYIELIGVENHQPLDRTSYDALAPCIAGGGGIPMLALSTDDASATRRALTAVGASTSEPLTWSRSADTPDGQRTASFTTMFVQSALLPGFVVFFCQHHTRELVFHRSWQIHPNGAVTVLGIERSTPDDVGRIGQRLSSLLGANQIVAEADGSLRVRLGRHYIRYRHAPGQSSTRLILRAPSFEKLAQVISERIQRTADSERNAPLSTVRAVSLCFVPEPINND